MPELEIELTDEQEERLRREAERQGVSIDQAAPALLRRFADRGFVLPQ